MDLESLIKEVGRPCTLFDVGGFRPTNEIEESWLGRVTRYKIDEGIPVDKHGKEMLQLGQFYLPTLPHIPEQLAGVSLITVFISKELEGDSDLMDGCWEVREYSDLEIVTFKEFKGESTGFKAFPLKPRLHLTDCPTWDDGGLSEEQMDAFMDLERSGVISDYYDATNHQYSHKFGGYPSFCQSGVDLDPYEFVFQITSDSKIQLNVIDSGSLTFWKNPKDGSWKLYYDFY